MSPALFGAFHLPLHSIALEESYKVSLYSLEIAMAEHSNVSITPLLKRLWPDLPVPDAEPVTASEIALAISHIFTNSLSPVQCGALLTALHFKERDRQADVLFKCAAEMRNAAVPVDKKALRDVLRKNARKEGTYRGGLVWYAR